MKSTPKLIEILNALLADELAAFHQYTAHAARMKVAGYTRLADLIEKRGEQEAEHAAELTERIVFLGGEPLAAALGKVELAALPAGILSADLAAELLAVQRYNAGIQLAVEQGDQGTRALLEHILVEEESHTLAIEQHLRALADMGLQNWLSTLV